MRAFSLETQPCLSMRPIVDELELMTLFTRSNILPDWMNVAVLTSTFISTPSCVVLRDLKNPRQTSTPKRIGVLVSLVPGKTDFLMVVRLLEASACFIITSKQ